MRKKGLLEYCILIFALLGLIPMVATLVAAHMMEQNTIVILRFIAFFFFFVAYGCATKARVKDLLPPLAAAMVWNAIAIFAMII